MYRLEIANKNYSSWSLRPWVLMRERDIAFEERITPFAAGSNWETFRKFSPNGQVPCLHDGDEVIWESLAIVEYLAERHPGVWPSDAKARAFARCAAAEMHGGFSTLRNRCTMNVGLRVRLHDMPDALKRDIDRIGEIWSKGLARFGGPFLAGAGFTAVDAFFAPVAFRVQTYGLTLPAAAADYAQRVLALPAMRDWEQAALHETWREPGHEDEARQTGVIVEDRRAPAH
jgi:glutathione S-transferase